MTVVRPAEPSELPEVGALTVAAYEQYRTCMPDRLWEAYAAELADAAGRAERATVLVAVREDGLVGTATVGPATDDEGALHLRMVAVAPDARRSGAGRALMDAAIAFARARGARTLVWNTVSFMDDAKALYERLGYEPDPDVVGLGGDVSLLTYRLAL